MKKIEDMKREEVIDALRSQAHPQHFHSLLSWSTAHLKALLQYYRESDKEPRIFPSVSGIRKVPVVCACGLHWEHTGKHAPAGIILEIEVIHSRGR